MCYRYTTGYFESVLLEAAEQLPEVEVPDSLAELQAELVCPVPMLLG